MYLGNVDVAGFWGRARAEAQLYEGVNIFVGRNGSGKTTLINMIRAILTADLVAIAELAFDKATLRFREGGKPSRQLVVTKRRTAEGYVDILFQVDGEDSFGFELDATDYGQRRRLAPESRLRRRKVRPPRPLIVQLAELATVRWLSVLRYAGTDTETEWPAQFDSPADAKLCELQRDLQAYQLGLEKRESEASRSFQRETARMILYNPEFDSFVMSSSVWSDLGSQERELQKAFEELGIPRAEAAEQIRKHVEALRKSIEVYNHWKEGPKRRISIENLLALPLIKRSSKVVELVRMVDEKKREIFRKRDQFCELVHQFLEDKEVSFSPAGELWIRIRASSDVIPIYSLSSGEKQLLIHLIEALVQEERPCVFIGDEPELSMHVRWQERLLESMVELNPRAQIIVATHSPEIIGDFADRVRDMSEVVHERAG